MTRELIEAAKAVLEAAYYNVPHDVSTDQGAKRYAAFQRLYAAVRAAEAAPVADAERVLEAAKAAVIAIPGFKNISALSQWAVGFVADAIRPYITPAPVADTVAVPLVMKGPTYTVCPGLTDCVLVSVQVLPSLEQ